jgi:hypothetical protein
MSRQLGPCDLTLHCIVVRSLRRLPLLQFGRFCTDACTNKLWFNEKCMRMLMTMFDLHVGDVRADRTSSNLESLLLAYAAQAVENSL